MDLFDVVTLLKVGFHRQHEDKDFSHITTEEATAGTMFSLPPCQIW